MYLITKFASTNNYHLETVPKPPFCLSPPDQRVASFCTLTDMQHPQGLEGGPELPLCVDPASGKEFMDAAGYVGLWVPPSEPSDFMGSRKPRPRVPPLILQSPEKGRGGTGCPCAAPWAGPVHRGVQPLPTVRLPYRGWVWASGKLLPPSYCDSARRTPPTASACQAERAGLPGTYFLPDSSCPSLTPYTKVSRTNHLLPEFLMCLLPLDSILYLCRPLLIPTLYALGSRLTCTFILVVTKGDGETESAFGSQDFLQVRTVSTTFTEMICLFFSYQHEFLEILKPIQVVEMGTGELSAPSSDTSTLQI